MITTPAMWMANAVGAACIDKKIKKFHIFVDFLMRCEIHNVVNNETQHKTVVKTKSSEVDRLMDSSGDLGFNWLELVGLSDK